MIEELIQSLSAYQNIPVEKITKDAHLITDLGMESLDLLGMVCELEEKYGIEFDEDDVYELLTIEKIADYIKQKQEEM